MFMGDRIHDLVHDFLEEAGFDFVHDLGASAIFYGVIFVLWVVWANYGTPGPQRVRMRVAV